MSDRDTVASPPPATGRYLVLALLCTCAAIAYIQRSAISVPAQEIARQLQLTDLARQMGWVQSTWYLCYGLMQLPAGWLADRHGSRRMLSLFVILWSLATLATGLAGGFISLLILWGLMGAAQAGAFPCAAKAIGQIFPDHQRARATGLLAAGMAIGGALAPLITATLLEVAEPLARAGNGIAGGWFWRPMRCPVCCGWDCLDCWYPRPLAHPRPPALPGHGDLDSTAFQSNRLAAVCSTIFSRPAWYFS